jgi:uncharacterized membrane protein
MNTHAPDSVNEATMTLRRALFVSILASTPLALPALAQTAAPDATPANNASLTHSALKATTFKIGTTGTNLAILSYAAGGIIGGAALTTFLLGSSWVIYTANDYLWDSYAPPAAKQTDTGTFDATADVWRNTGKFLTYKPVIASIKLASLFAYTGSAGVTAVFGTASILTNTVVFYANNMAWDFYDWYSAAPKAAAVATR